MCVCVCGFNQETRLRHLTVLAEGEKAEVERERDESEGVEGSDGRRGTSVTRSTPVPVRAERPRASTGSPLLQNVALRTARPPL